MIELTDVDQDVRGWGGGRGAAEWRGGAWQRSPGGLLQSRLYSVHYNTESASVLYLGDVGRQEEAGHRPPAGVVEDSAPQQRVSAHRAPALLLRAARGGQLRGTWGKIIEL